MVSSHMVCGRTGRFGTRAGRPARTLPDMSSLLAPSAPIERPEPRPRSGPAAPPPPVPRLWRVRYEPELAQPTAVSTRPDRWPPPLQPASPDVEPDPAAADLPAPGRRTGPSVGEQAPRAESIEARHAITRQLRTALEVFDGRRPPAHIADQVAPSVLRYWRAAAQQRHPRRPARFTRIRLCLPRSGVAEVAVTCDIDGRARALAARFERTRGRWLCTALRLG
jgi:hypothetical protein